MRRPVTLDQSGRVIANDHRRSLAGGGRNMGSLGRDYSIGAQIWEMTHPEQVQEEYRAVGLEVPSKLTIVMGSPLNRFGEPIPYGVADVLGNVAENIETSVEAVGGAIGEAAGAAGEAAATVAKYGLVALVLAAVIVVASRSRA